MIDWINKLLWKYTGFYLVKKETLEKAIWYKKQYNKLLFDLELIDEEDKKLLN